MSGFLPDDFDFFAPAPRGTGPLYCVHCRSRLQTIPITGGNQLFSKWVGCKICPICDKPGHVPEYAVVNYERARMRAEDEQEDGPA